MPNIEVIMMGDKFSAKEEYIKKIELTIRRLTLGSVVKFVSSQEDVAQVMSSLDVLVSANREQEAFGRSVIEAQARGLPVVATRVGGVIENVMDEKTGLVSEPGNPREMAEKILRYINDLSLSQKIARAARKHVEGNYSIQRTMALTMAAYARAKEEKKILIFKISSLGDIILATPSLKAIRERYSGGTCVKVLVDVRFRNVLTNCPYVDEVITCDFSGRDNGIGFLKLAAQLRAEDFDMSIDLQNSKKSHLLAFLSAIPERYGYDNKKMSFLINRKIGLPEKTLQPVEHQACVLGLMGITHLENKLELWPETSDKEWVEQFFKDSWLKDGQKLVAFSISASRKWQTKNWGVSHMAEVAGMLAKQKGMRIVLIGAKEDRELGDKFMKKTKAKPINAIGKTNIPRLISLIERCDVLLTGDSAPMHISAAVETPFVAIFGPTDPAKHLPPGARQKILYKKQKCSPCYESVCTKKMKCMTAIKPAEVYDAIIDMVDGPPLEKGKEVNKSFSS